MSYRPENQALEDHARAIVDGIDKLSDAIDCRIDHRNEWKSEHLEKIAKLKIKLAKLRVKLVTLAEETW